MQKGFGFIGILIIIAVIAGVGAFAFDSLFPDKSPFRPSEEEKSAVDMAEQAKNVLEQKNTETTPPTNTSKDETADWKTYRSEQSGYEFIAPDMSQFRGWTYGVSKLLEKPNNQDFKNFIKTLPESQPSDLIKVSADDPMILNGHAMVKVTTILQEYTIQIKTDYYFIEKNGESYVRINIYPGAPPLDERLTKEQLANRDAEINKMISSFKFTQ
ncbi:MAG: hypothetical protein A3H64_03895 [Candidatus Ryanbacteria bacterium RIFCSPLOWO2_02_FULL_45_11c]|uniref:Uncharacterized protein n=1 Tax=Candidatus Ryanbacteria bacterium RIFCSPLOWO2_02_FULL_45_11c TaxID=1802128 RepID=A0A1G2GUW2_9BACT|nr:MAG: hypothetical protein A3H64_03895 [Candidatus Ryanbacteria bacterium RIFCSPLOWO2_02_FULL_45_11c]